MKKIIFLTLVTLMSISLNALDTNTSKSNEKVKIQVGKFHYLDVSNGDIYFTDKAEMFHYNLYGISKAHEDFFKYLEYSLNEGQYFKFIVKENGKVDLKISKGRSLSVVLVKIGLATPNYDEIELEDVKSFTEAEEYAKINKLGAYK